MARSVLTTRCLARLNDTYARLITIVPQRVRNQSTMSIRNTRPRPHGTPKKMPFKADGWKRHSLGVDGWHEQTTTMQSEIRANIFLEPFSPEDLQLEASLLRDGKHAMRILQEHADAGRLTTNVIRICLEAASRALWRIPRNQRLKMLQQQEHKNHAKTVLRLILSDIHLWLPLVTFDDKSTFLLCWFAVAEGLDGLVLDWLKVDIKSDPNIKPIELPRLNPEEWRTRLVRRIIEACLAFNANHDATHAIQCFLIIEDWKANVCEKAIPWYKRSQTALEHFANKINLFMGMRAISGKITSGSAHHTNVQAFEAYQRKSGNMHDQLPTAIKGYGSAVLDMFHPKQPSPAAFLDLMRPMLQDVDSMIQLKERHGDPNNVPMRVWERAYTLSLAAGNANDAALIKSSYEKVYDRNGIDFNISQRGQTRRLLTTERKQREQRDITKGRHSSSMR